MVWWSLVNVYYGVLDAMVLLVTLGHSNLLNGVASLLKPALEVVNHIIPPNVLGLSTVFTIVLRELIRVAANGELIRIATEGWYPPTPFWEHH